MPEPMNPPDPYPNPPHCCAHVSNAHARDHCKLCDCEKAPRVVYPGAPPRREPEGERQPEFDVDILHPCRVCGALTGFPEDREKHIEYHERSINVMRDLTLGLSTLASTLKLFAAPTTTETRNSDDRPED